MSLNFISPLKASTNTHPFDDTENSIPLAHFFSYSMSKIWYDFSFSVLMRYGEWMEKHVWKVLRSILRFLRQKSRVPVYKTNILVGRCVRNLHRERLETSQITLPQPYMHVFYRNCRKEVYLNSFRAKFTRKCRQGAVEYYRVHNLLCVGAFLQNVVSIYKQKFNERV